MTSIGKNCYTDRMVIDDDIVLKSLPPNKYLISAEGGRLSYTENTPINSSGNETIDGIKTFTSTIVGTIDQANKLTNKLNIGSNLTLASGEDEWDAENEDTINLDLDLSSYARKDQAQSFSGTQTFVQKIVGNIDTANKLKNSRTIAGVSFDGSANIDITSSGLQDANNICLLDNTQTITGIKTFESTNNQEIIPSELYYDLSWGQNSLFTGYAPSVQFNDNQLWFRSKDNNNETQFFFSTMLSGDSLYGQTGYLRMDIHSTEGVTFNAIGKDYGNSTFPDMGFLSQKNQYNFHGTSGNRIYIDCNNFEIAKYSSGVRQSTGITFYGNLTGNAGTATLADKATKIDTTLNGFVKTTSGDGTLSIGNLVSDDIPNNGADTTGNALTADKATALNTTLNGFVKTTSSNGTLSIGNLVSGDIPNNSANTSGSSGSCTGNSLTATTLQTARTIAEQSFDGSADITIASTNLSDTSNIALLDNDQTISGLKTFTNEEFIIRNTYLGLNSGMKIETGGANNIQNPRVTISYDDTNATYINQTNIFKVIGSSTVSQTVGFFNEGVDANNNNKAGDMYLRFRNADANFVIGVWGNNGSGTGYFKIHNSTTQDTILEIQPDGTCDFKDSDIETTGNLTTTGDLTVADISMDNIVYSGNDVIHIKKDTQGGYPILRGCIIGPSTTSHTFDGTHPQYHLVGGSSNKVYGYGNALYSQNNIIFGASIEVGADTGTLSMWISNIAVATQPAGEKSYNNAIFGATHYVNRGKTGTQNILSTSLNHSPQNETIYSLINGYFHGVSNLQYSYVGGYGNIVGCLNPYHLSQYPYPVTSYSIIHGFRIGEDCPIVCYYSAIFGRSHRTTEKDESKRSPPTTGFYTPKRTAYSLLSGFNHTVKHDGVTLLGYSQTSNAHGALQTSGEIWCDGGTVNPSDRRVKKDIVDASLDNSYDIIKNLKVRKYKYTDNYRKSLLDNPSSGEVWGFIAQEVEEIYPDAVKTIPEKELFEPPEDTDNPDDVKPPVLLETIHDFKSLEKQKLVYPMVGAIQKLMNEVEELKQEIKILKENK